MNISHITETYHRPALGHPDDILRIVELLSHR
jgi:hypothetical protein